MREVDFKDERGRWYRVRLPDEAPDEDAPLGIPVGPLDVVDGLGLPEDVATRLHNQLHARHIYTAREADRHAADVMAAVQAAYRVDAARIMQAFHDLPVEA